MLASVCGRIGEVLRFGLLCLTKAWDVRRTLCMYLRTVLSIMHATLEERGEGEGRKEGVQPVGVGRMGCVGLTGNNQGNRRGWTGQPATCMRITHHRLPMPISPRVSSRVARHWASVCPDHGLGLSGGGGFGDGSFKPKRLRVDMTHARPAFAMEKGSRPLAGIMVSLCALAFYRVLGEWRPSLSLSKAERNPGRADWTARCHQR